MEKRWALSKLLHYREFYVGSVAPKVRALIRERGLVTYRLHLASRSRKMKLNQINQIRASEKEQDVRRITYNSRCWIFKCHGVSNIHRCFTEHTRNDMYGIHSQLL